MSGESINHQVSLELVLQDRLANDFIGRVARYVENINKAESLTDRSRVEAEVMSRFVRQYEDKEINDVQGRLLASEDLGDLVAGLVLNQRLDARSEPAGALLDYRPLAATALGLCPKCEIRPKTLPLSQVCVRCYFE
ncbi:MAG: hypothetical protein ACREF5_00450 [Candidatus Saccharimonadales bacterium]